MQYKLSIGVWKALMTALGALGAFVVFAGLSDVTFVQLIQQYIFPLLGTMTVGGLVKLATNFIKINYLR